MPAVTLLAPVWLWLALAIPLVWFLPRRLDDRVHGALRSAVLLLVVLAAARPVSFTTTDDAWHVVVLDAHGSTEASAVPAAEALARTLAERAPADDATVLVRLGALRYGPTEAGAADVAFDTVLHVRPSGESYSSVARGLELAGRAIPDGARGSITLLTDGLATDTRWGPVVQDLQARGLPVHTIQLPAEDPASTILGVDVPAALRVGHAARLGVRLRGRSTIDVEARLDGDRILARLEGVEVDGFVTLPVDWEPKEAGIHQLEIRLMPAGTPWAASDTSFLFRVVAVQEPLRVLYLGERMAEGGPRLADLVGPGFAFDVPPIGTPLGPDRVRDADVVVLDDRPAASVPASVQAAIARAVREGETGLLMAGGRASFGAGGWQRSPLAKVLPIELVQKEEKRDPSTTLVVIIDTSGSMGGNRVQLAKEVSRLAIRRLLPHDKVGIVEFYGAKRWAAPIQPASNAIEIQRALNRLNAGGGTVIMPAIEEAFYGLQNVRTRYKHVLVLTDGGVETGAFEPLLRRMADKGITVSTVLVGPGMHSEFLVNLANWGKGRFYSVPNRFNLPEVLLKQPASAHLPSWRPGLHAVTVQGESSWWEGVDPTSMPPLAGYVEARARPRAQTLLETRAAGHPLLSTWRHGLGRATVLLTEPTGPGTAPWQDWSDYGTWLGRILARTAADTRQPYDLHARYDERAVVLTVDRLHRAAPAPTVTFRPTSEAPFASVKVRRRGPDRFEVRVPRSLAEAFRVQAGAGSPLLYAAPQPDWTWEHHEDPRTALDLAALSTSTGGAARALAAGAALPSTVGGGTAPVDVVALWPWCLLLALLVYLVELAWRRRPTGGMR